MPQKNTLKEYAPDSYYHIYFRGANKQRVFLGDKDFSYFIGLFERYLSGVKRLSSAGLPYPEYSREIKLLAYCLMPNHVHMLVYQAENPDALRRFMSSMLTSYSKYFNQKYYHLGPVFESRYKGKRVENEAYRSHISRYIHMNPYRWLVYKYSSLPFMFSDSPSWLTSDLIERDFQSKEEYMAFLREYQGNKNALEEVKQQLADAGT